MFKVWVSIERPDCDDDEPAPLGSFDTIEEAEAFARTVGWTPFNEKTEYEKLVQGHQEGGALSPAEYRTLDEGRADENQLAVIRKVEQLRDVLKDITSDLHTLIEDIEADHPEVTNAS